jgi:hypothetical protein
MTGNIEPNHNLLIPRYEVIADYPSSPYSVGTIIVELPEYKNARTDMRQWPHLFRPLLWYELRHISEMPKCCNVVVDRENDAWAVVELEWKPMTRDYENSRKPGWHGKSKDGLTVMLMWHHDGNSCYPVS